LLSARRRIRELETELAIHHRAAELLKGKRPSRPPQDASQGLLAYSILRLTPPRGSLNRLDLAITNWLYETIRTAKDNGGARRMDEDQELPDVGKASAIQLSTKKVTLLVGCPRRFE
jgi:hypothetical protein